MLVSSLSFYFFFLNYVLFNTGLIVPMSSISCVYRKPKILCYHLNFRIDLTLNYVKWYCILLPFEGKLIFPNRPPSQEVNC